MYESLKRPLLHEVSNAYYLWWHQMQNWTWPQYWICGDDEWEMYLMGGEL